MPTSFPSKPVTSINIPDVQNFKAEFHYNFFSPDEKVNDSGELSDSLKKILFDQPSVSIDAGLIANIVQRFPRYVKFSFSKCVAQKNLENEYVTIVGNNSSENNSVHGSAKERNFIGKNIKKILNETNFFKEDFIGLDFQDDNIDGKLFALVSGSIERKIASNNSQILSNIQQSKTSIFDKLSKTNSLMDKAKSFNGISSQDITTNFVADALNNIQKLGVSFVNEKNKKEIINNKFEKIKNVSLRGQINKKFFGTIISNVSNDAMSIFADEFSNMVAPAQAIEKSAVIEENANTIKETDYDQKISCGAEVTTTAPRAGTDIDAFNSSIEIIGYMIDKMEILPNGLSIKHTPLIIENPASTITFDKKIKYGSRYIYSAKSIALAKFQTVSTDTNEIIILPLLISSKSTSKIVIDCVENVAPPHPVDFNIVWDYKTRLPRLTWNLPPTNKQRDIKRFQIFRRKNINEAFQLIKEYNFDDSIIKTQNLETPAEDLITIANGPINYFLDQEFKKDSKYIYAICSIDAHGFTSNYSIQFEISFDRFKNKIIKKMISGSGAPKSYPNMLLKTLDTFIDTIKNSNHTKMSIYFDPEFLEITNKNGNNVRLLSTNKNGGCYKINIINTDLQKMANLEIKIDDLRK